MKINNDFKLVKSMTDFTNVIKQRNNKIKRDVINNTLKEHQDGTFKPDLIKGSKIDIYA